MSDALKTMEKVQKNAEQNATEGRDTRFVRTFPEAAGAVRQGDIYIWPIKEVPKGATPRADHQLALGNSVGSRHVASAGVKLYDRQDTAQQPLLGPIVEAKERWDVTHPEHAHFSLPSGVYQVGYQLDMSTRQAVID